MLDPVTQDLNRYMRQEDEAAKRDSDIEQIVAFKKEQILNDEVLFQQLDEDYELDVYGQVLRALRSLDVAKRDFNAMHIMLINSGSSQTQMQMYAPKLHNIDAVFTALSVIQKNMEVAIEHQAESEYNGRIE